MVQAATQTMEPFHQQKPDTAGQVIVRIMAAQYANADALQETTRYIKTAGFDGVMLMNNWAGNGEPAHYSPERIRERAAMMREAMAHFRDAGYPVSINNLCTIGMKLSPPAQYPFGIQPLIEFNGKVLSECFCPLDPAFHEYLRNLFGAWAALEPDSIWIDDDFRIKTSSGACFCPLHLKQLHKNTGHQFDRQSLVDELQENPDSPLAATWQTIQKESLLHAARTIEEAVHSVNPAIPIGLMGVAGSVDLYGSDYLNDLTKVLCPRGPVLLRPEVCAYNDLYRIGWSAYYPLWACRRLNNQNVKAFPEFETWPGTQFNHSRRVTRMKYEWAAVHGFRNALDSAMWQSYQEEPDLPEYQRETFQRFRRLRELFADEELVARGVSLELPEANSGIGATHGAPVRAAVSAARLGLPLWPDGGYARVLSGNSALRFLDVWDDLVADGVLLDQDAYQAVLAAGRSDLVGITKLESMPRVPARERFADELALNCGAKVIPLEWATSVRSLLQAVVFPANSPVEVLSWFEDENGTRLSPATWRLQTLRGRLAVLPFSFADNGAQYAMVNWRRKCQVEWLLEWLADKPLPVKISSHADISCVYRESRVRNRVILAFANYSQDTATRLEVEVPAVGAWKKSRVRRWNPDGEWRNLEAESQDSKLSLSGILAIEPQTVEVLEWAEQL